MSYINAIVCCHRCGNEFESPTGPRIKGPRRKYCSNECAESYDSGSLEKIEEGRKRYYADNRGKIAERKREKSVKRRAYIATAEAMMMINRMNRDIEENANF